MAAPAPRCPRSDVGSDPTADVDVLSGRLARWQAGRIHEQHGSRKHLDARGFLSASASSSRSLEPQATAQQGWLFQLMRPAGALAVAEAGEWISHDLSYSKHNGLDASPGAPPTRMFTPQSVSGLTRHR